MRWAIRYTYIMHIAIAGNIGAGKTTLTKMLAKRYGWTAHFEPVDNNPYLEDYYNDMTRWSFNLQIYFLNKRFRDVVEILQSKDTIIQDRTIFEDARIFAPNLYDMGLMSERDFNNYTDLFDLMLSLVKLPDLMIYIRCSIPRLIDHIQQRGRDYLLLQLVLQRVQLLKLQLTTLLLMLRKSVNLFVLTHMIFL